MPPNNDLPQPVDLKKVFRHYLRHNGIKNTQARRHILDVVLGMGEHFEAEQVLYRLHENNISVGKATVYRTLPLLVDCGILKTVRFDVKQTHYEFVYGQDPHDHMVCHRCGRIVEFSSDKVIQLRTQLASEHRFHITGHRLQLTGLCWDCANDCPLAGK